MQFQFTAEHHGLARQQSARVHAAGVNPAKEISQKLEPIQLGIAGLQVLIFVGMELYAWLGGDTAACPIGTTWLKVDAIASIVCYSLYGFIMWKLFTMLTPIIKEHARMEAEAKRRHVTMDEDAFNEKMLPIMMESMASAMCVLCLLIPVGLFLIGWEIYGLVIFFRTAESSTGHCGLQHTLGQWITLWLVLIFQAISCILPFVTPSPHTDSESDPLMSGAGSA